MKRWLISLSAAILLLVLMPVVKAEALAPATSTNINKHDYSGYYNSWGTLPKSFLTTTSDGGYMRVESVGSRVVIEYYNAALQITSQQYINNELPLFGGFYEGRDYYFLAFAQENLNQYSGVETLRVVRYSKNWQRQAACYITTGNSYRPLYAGSLSMVQNGDFLYVQTCHEKYADSSGTHHQSKMTFSIRISTMVLRDKNHAGGSISKGFVSHSFNQFSKMDGSSLVTVDHGDANPRSIVLCRYNNHSDGSAAVSSYVSYVDLLNFDSRIGENQTGATVGDFQVTSSHYLVAGSSIYQQAGSYYSDSKNVYLIAVSKSNFASKKMTFFTSEDPAARKSFHNPYLIKITDNQLMLLWGRDDKIYYCYVNAAGNRISQTLEMPGSLSDCHPVVSKGFVVWYTTDRSAPKFQSIDTFGGGRTGWYTTGGNTYYLNSAGQRVTGWLKQGSDKYFLNNQGIMLKGWVKISGKTYYFNTETGKMLTGWASGANGDRYYFSKSSGEMLTGTRKISNQFCVFGDNGVFQNYLPAGKQTVGGKTYYLGAEGKVLTGWRTISKKKYYFKKSDGTMAKGFTTIGGKKYYFNKSTGVMLTGTQKISGVYYIFDSKGVYKKKAAPGWLTLSGKKYYLTSASKPTTGWKTISGKKYYFSKSTGAMLKGWQTISGKKYYFNTSGVMVKNTVKLSGAYYIFDSKGVYKSKAKPGWFTLSGKKYYLTSASKPTTGWKTISGKKYYFNKDGVMVKGLTKIGTTVYRFTDTGVYKGYASKGIQKVGSKRYYVVSKGKISTGWKTVKKQKYYFGKDGAMVTGWKTISGKKYYFNNLTGVMAKGTMQAGGQFCKFSSTGVFKSYVAKGKQKIAGKTYYIGDKGKVYKGWKTIGGKKYYLRKSDGVMLTGWQKIGGKKYYLGKTGAAATKTTQIDGVFYSFANEGQCLGRYGKGWLYLNGKEYYLDSSSRPVKGFKKMNDGIYYFDKKTGVAKARGWFTLSGKKYYSFGGGWLATGWVGFDGYIYEFKESGVYVRKVGKY